MRGILNTTHDSWIKVILYLYFLFTEMYNLTYHNASNITEQSYICTTLADNYKCGAVAERLSIDLMSKLFRVRSLARTSVLS